jgi:hypothetical protein
VQPAVVCGHDANGRDSVSGASSLHRLPESTRLIKVVAPLAVIGRQVPGASALPDPLPGAPLAAPP